MDNTSTLINDFDNLFNESDKLEKICRYMKDMAQVKGMTGMLVKVDAFQAEQNMNQIVKFNSILAELMEIIDKKY